MPILDQSKADMDDPQQHVAWALTPVPISADGRPLVLPLTAIPYISEHLYKFGFRHHPELQTHKYAQAETSNFMAANTRVIPVDEEESAPVPAVDLSQISDAEADAVQAALDRRKGTSG